MKRKILLAAIIAWVLLDVLFVLVQLKNRPSVSYVAQATAITCPTGQYNAGDFCRVIPTGCPYGDSIPVDSPKCVPSPEDKIKQEGVIAPIQTETWGK